MQVPFTRSNIIMAWVQKGKVQRRKSRRTWLPSVICVRSRWVSTACLLAPILCDGWGSKRREQVAVGYRTHMGKSKAERWKKSAYVEVCVKLSLCLTVKFPNYTKLLCNERGDFAPCPFCPFLSPSPCRSNVDATLTLLRFSYLYFIYTASYRVNLATELC